MANLERTDIHLIKLTMQIVAIMERERFAATGYQKKRCQQSTKRLNNFSMFFSSRFFLIQIPGIFSIIETKKDNIASEASYMS